MSEPFAFFAICAFAISALTVDTMARTVPAPQTHCAACQAHAE